MRVFWGTQNTDLEWEQGLFIISKQRGGILVNAQILNYKQDEGIKMIVKERVIISNVQMMI